MTDSVSVRFLSTSSLFLVASLQFKAVLIPFPELYQETPDYVFEHFWFELLFGMISNFISTRGSVTVTCMSSKLQILDSLLLTFVVTANAYVPPAM